MNNLHQLPRETKEGTAKSLIEHFGGQWDNDFSVNPGSTIKLSFFKYLKKLVEDQNKKEADVAKFICDLIAGGVEIKSVTFPNGSPQINLK